MPKTSTSTASRPGSSFSSPRRRDQGEEGYGSATTCHPRPPPSSLQLLLCWLGWQGMAGGHCI